MEDYDDERVRLIFSRLQRGKPLQIGERLNAKPGAIVQSMRAIANHPFLAQSVAIARTAMAPFQMRLGCCFMRSTKQSNAG